MADVVEVKICSITGEPQCKCSYEQQGIFTVHPRDTLRKLFTDHAFYTKMVITAVLDKRPEADALTKRLLSNQSEIGEYFGLYIDVCYGTAVGELLTEHIKRANDILISINQNMDLAQGKQDVSSPEIDDKIYAFIKNVEDVSKGLVSAPNNNLDYGHVYNEFYRHNLYIIDLIKSHLNKTWDIEIKICDSYYSHMLKFSDILYQGLLD